MRNIQSFSARTDVQSALDNNELGKPYVALVDGYGIDWNGLDAASQENWVDIRTIDNNTPFYNVAWSNVWSTTTKTDSWFSEKSGLTTDSNSVRKGKTEATGYYSYHRFSRYFAYTCTFDTQYKTGDGVRVEYGKSVVDENIGTLPTKEINGNTYYTLNIVDWDNWLPLYAPFSTEELQSDRFPVGGILVDIAPKS